MLKLADLFFTCFHSIIIVFNLFGWVFRATRKWNLIILLLTGASWVGLGLFYGPGYCPLTDWHFRILEHLGHSDLPTSYISFLVQRFTGLNPDQGIVDAATLGGLALAMLISVYMNFKDWFHRLAGLSKQQ